MPKSLAALALACLIAAVAYCCLPAPQNLAPAPATAAKPAPQSPATSSEPAADEPVLAASTPAEAAPAAPERKVTRSYALRFDGHGGETASQALRVEQTPNAVELKAEGKSLRLEHDEQGALSGTEAEGLAPLQSILAQAKGDVVHLPGGAYLEVRERQVKRLLTEVKGGRDCVKQRVRVKVRGRLADGERFSGTVQSVLWLDARSKDLVALRAKEVLAFEHRGAKTLNLELSPGGETKVGLGPAGAPGSLKLPAGARRVARTSSSAPRASVAALAGGVGLTLLFVLGMAALSQWLGGSKALCLVLALAMVLLPMAETSEAKWWDSFSDPSRDEIAWTLLAGISVAVGASIAAATAPVWVPLAIAGAGVTALGAYWVTREPPIRKGEVIKKVYEPERTYLTYMPQVVVTTDGKTTTTTTIMVPMWIHDDEDHVVTIEEGGRTRKVYLDAEAYAKVRVGQHYDMDSEGGEAEDKGNNERKASDAERSKLDTAKAEGRGEVALDTRSGAADRLPGN